MQPKTSNHNASDGVQVDALLDERSEMNEQRREILATLLGKAIARNGHFAAFASAMGKTVAGDGSTATPVPSFTVLHSLEWISRHIRLGSEMPFMENKIDHETGRLIVDYSNADEIKQRAPDWTRQAALAAYLAQPQRKFGPIMAVISPAWVEDPSHENWDENRRAKQGAAEFLPLEPGGTVGLVKLDGVRVYALDGQHRVLGMRGLRDLRDQGFIQLRTKDGTARDANFTRDQFIESFGLTIEELQAVFNDSMPVEYIPAVVTGETHSEATRRIRRTFIALNSYAKKTEKGENILLDETDGYAIVARRLAVNHPLFEGGGTHRRVNWKTTSIPNGRTPFITTLGTLQEIAQSYLPAVAGDVVRRWETPISGMVPVRPPDTDIDLAYERLAELFDHIRKLPIFKRLEDLDIDDNLAALEKWREFPKYSRTGQVLDGTGGNRGHLLLRPLGQTILANAVAELAAPEDRGGYGLTLRTIFRRIAEIDAAEGFEARRTKSIWYGVTYAPTTNRIINRNKSWAHQLLIQLVAGISDAEAKQQLWWNWVTARAIDRDNLTWRNQDGKLARFSWDDSELPTPIRG
jgi:hypothetical protein